MRYVEVEEVENLKILADTSSVEVFVNDGEYVFSTRYPEVYKLQAEAVGANFVRNYVTKYQSEIPIISKKITIYQKEKSFSREIFKRYMVIFNTNVCNRSCQWQILCMQEIQIFFKINAFVYRNMFFYRIN